MLLSVLNLYSTKISIRHLKRKHTVEVWCELV